MLARRRFVVKNFFSIRFSLREDVFGKLVWGGGLYSEFLACQARTFLFSIAAASVFRGAIGRGRVSSIGIGAVKYDPGVLCIFSPTPRFTKGI